MRGARSGIVRRCANRRAVLGVVVGVSTVTTLTFSLTAPDRAEADAAAQRSAPAASAVVQATPSTPVPQPVTSAVPGAALPSAPATSAAPATTPAAPAPAPSAAAGSSAGRSTTPGAKRPAPSPTPTATRPAPAPAPAPAPTVVPPPVAPPAPPSSQVPAGSWLSGAAGIGAANGQLGSWRGAPLDIASTWADNNTAQVEVWQLQPGGEFGSWNKPLDVAIGAIGDQETWSQAAAGAYDARWRASLTKLRDLWGPRSATMYIRFAHEMNSNWYPWSVDASEAGDFVTSWKRFRALQQEVFPASQLVFNVNRESVGNGIDWRKTFPGSQYVDVMSVDYYNQYPYVATAADWQASLNATDQYGAPKGLQAHLDFARSVGLPLAVSEWSGKARDGDSPAFISGMHDFFSAHAGGGAGQLLYEVLFNVEMNDSDFVLFGNTKMPASAARYREDF